MPRRPSDTHESHTRSPGRLSGLLRGISGGLLARHRDRAAAALLAAVDAARPAVCMEGLEGRRYLATISGSGTLEYKDSSDGLVRIAYQNLTAELIFINVNDGAIFGTLTGTPVAASDGETDGRDLFHIYIAESNADSHFSIARVPALTTTPRPMQPFGSGVSFAARNLRSGEVEDFTAGPGEVLIGGLTRGEEDLENNPIDRAEFSGIGLMGPTPNGNLIAGITIEQGQDFGRMMIGGTVFGEVTVAESIDTFYAGGIVTGQSRGANEGAVTNPSNFFVGGDIRNLIAGGSIGTHIGAGTELEEPTYQSGFDLEVRGTVHQVRSRAAIHGSGTIFNATNAPGLTYAINELELRIDPALERGNTTDFQNFEFGDEDINDEMFVNDDQNRAQYVGTFNSDELGENAILINGIIQRTTRIFDYADHYAVGLMAGQTVTVRLFPLVPRFLNVGVFDPDGRLIASDYGTTAQRRGISTGAPFSFVAKRPGVYRIAVAGNGEADFVEGGEFDPTVLPGLIPYQLQILGAAGANRAGIGLGGLVAVDGAGANTIFDAAEGEGLGPAGWRVIRGDLGGVDADNSILSNSDRTFVVDEGNLRGVEAERIGEIQGNLFSRGIDLIVPNGSVGLIRATDEAGILYINKNIATSSTTIPGEDVEVIFPQAVGFDYQTLDAAGTFYGNIVANGRIGVVRAGSMATNAASIFAANDDNVGNDGIIDLIDVAGDFGMIGNGPQLSAGDGGNIRYIRVGGIAFRDAFFGGGQPETFTSTAGQLIDMVDDSGTPFQINPFPLIFRRNPVSGRNELVNPPQLTVEALPVRRSRGGGGAGGLVTLEVTSTGGVRVVSNSAGGRGSVEIGTIASSGAGTAVIVNRKGNLNPNDDVLELSATGTDLSVHLTGNATTDILEITGGQFRNIFNDTPTGEIVSVTATSIGSLRATNIGLPKSHTGYGSNNLNGTQWGHTEVNPIDAFGADDQQNVFPFNDQRYGIFANTIVEIRSRQALGNIVVMPDGAPGGLFPATLQLPGSIERIIANFDASAANVHEGINAPIYASGQIRYIQIGEGVLPSGTGSFSHAGIYANDTIQRVVNQGVMHSDIRGDIVSENGIRRIELVNGSIINADIQIYTDATDTHTGDDLRASSELPVPRITSEATDPIDRPTFQIELIRLSGVGGIMGASIGADDIGTISVADGGFGMFQTEIDTLGDGVIDNISLDGYGMRTSELHGGAQLNNLNAFGSGSYRTELFSDSVRLSEKSNGVNPYFLTRHNALTDLHMNLGTDSRNMRVHRESAGGTIGDSIIVMSRRIGSVSGQVVSRSIFNAGNDILNISMNDYIDDLDMATGNIGSVNVRRNVSRSAWSASGRIDQVRIGGHVPFSTTIRATGPNGVVNSVIVGGTLEGHVFATLDINNLKARHIGSVSRTIGAARFEGIYAGRDIGTLTTDGDIRGTARIRALDDIGFLHVGRDVLEGANITVNDQILRLQVDGQIFGDILVGRPT